MSVIEPALQDIHIFGEHNHVTQVAGNLVSGPTYIQQTEQNQAFFQVQLASLRRSAAPSNLVELAEHTRRCEVALLGGTYDDKPTVARQVAQHLAEEPVWTQTGEAKPVLEWSGTADFSALLRGIEKQDAPSVLVLPNVLPQHLGYDILRLRNAVTHGGHLAVATTERGLETWSVAGASTYWYELETEGLFGTDTLKRALAEGLESVRASLPRDALDPVAPSLAGVPLTEIAAKLGTPGNVEVFIQQLGAGGPEQTLGPEQIRTMVQDATSPRIRVEKWFHGVLQPDEQVLALGLAFFDDLYDDQFFAALERWVEFLRERRNPAQRAYDYSDVESMQAFLTRVEGSLAGTRFTSRWAGQRSMLLQTAWRTHRRTLLSALPVLARLAADSVPGREGDWELYGSSERREQIRDAIGWALSDMGLLSAPGVQHALLQLAADPAFTVQSVAARAVARWRETGADAQLFKTLKGWQEDARLRAVIAAILVGRKEEKANGSLTYIRATIAVAIAYASGYDAPGELHGDLLKLFQTLARDGNRMVRDRFSRFTLPIVLSLHLRQLRPELRQMLRDEELAAGIAAALAHTYRTNPGEVVETLDEWRSDTGQRPDSIDPRRVTERDRLLMAVAFAYGEIDYSVEGPLSADQAFQWLRHVLATERHPRVRTAVVVAISLQARRNFAWVEPLMQKAMAEIMTQERDEVVRILSEVYVEQRTALKGGTLQRTINGHSIPLWTDAARPRTEVESAMLRWLCDASTPAAQQIAVLAFMAFALNVDQAAGVELGRYREQREQRAADDAAARVSSTPAHMLQEPGWYTGTYVPWLATLGDERYASILRGLLPEALAQSVANDSTLQFVLGNWEHATGEPAEVTRYLRRALAWHATAWILIPAVAVVLMILLAILF
jgi:hypothetical protein